MSVGDGIALAGLVLSLTTLLINHLERRRERRSAVLKALQGDKEAIAFAAFNLIRDPTQISSSDRDKVAEALCLAWVMESSDRASALVLKALHTLRGEARLAPASALHTLADAVHGYEESLRSQGAESKDVEARVRRAKSRLQTLRGALDGVETAAPSHGRPTNG
jgi:hypothetical protein